MNSTAFIRRWLAYPQLRIALYAAFCLFVFTATIVAIHGAVESYSAGRNAADRLAQLEQRARRVVDPAEKSAVARPPGSPFLEGQAANVASAALLQRVTGAITRAGGTIWSTEVELPSAPSGGYVKSVVSCQLDPLALQQVLYDIEAGMPFLFVEQLTITQLTPSDNGQLRVVLGVSGAWPRGR